MHIALYAYAFLESTLVEFWEMGCSIVGCARSISGGATIATEDHDLPQECLLNRFVEIFEVFEVTSNNHKS